MNTNRIKTEIAAFPVTPGVYVMRNKNKEVIYVGKARNLKSRVSSYFSGSLTLKTSLLMRNTENIDTILTSTEYEALVLENTLIKKYTPQYNITLKDGKTYPVIRITNEKFPRIFRTRRVFQDGSDYYGPYPHAKAVDIYIELIHKLYPMRRCKSLKRRDKPCLYYHIKRCSAPCIGNVDENEYGKNVKKIRTLLAGQTIGFRKELEKNMKSAATELNFEKAAELRDALGTLDILDAEHTVMDFNEDARDYMDYAVSGRHIVFAVLQTREGLVADRQLYFNEYAGDSGEALPEFLLQYYAKNNRPRPGILFIPEAPSPLVEQFFKEDNNNLLRIQIPEKKKDMAILAMARQNAEAELDRIIRKEGDLPALEELKRILSLPEIPHRIEGFDIAHLHGKHTVASQVSFLDGRPDKSGYRLYGIKSTDGTIDDYKSIAEVVGRRCQHLLNEESPLPDLILVDGGRGQVSAALRILEALEIDKKTALLGLAKKNEEIWLPHRADPVWLPSGDPGLRILQHVRDEAHRTATARNQLLRSKDITLSTLEGVPGIGPARSARLIKSFKTLEGIYDKSAVEIARTTGVGDEVAETVREFLGKTLESREIGREVRSGRNKQR